MAKRISLIVAVSLVALFFSGNVHARMRSRNVEHINQAITTNTTITASFGGYWYIQSDEIVQVNLDGGVASVNYVVIAADEGIDWYPVYVPVGDGVNFHPTATTTNLKILVTDQ